MFTDMFNAIDEQRQPTETFYDGYIVNAIIDAAYASVKTGVWEPVQIDDWRGSTNAQVATEFAHYDEQFYLIKEEILPQGSKKLILKDKLTGEVMVRDV